MKIVMLGNFRVDFTTESHWARSYEKLGHEVVRLQESEATTDQLYQTAKDADFVHYVHTHGWRTKGTFSLERAWERLRERGIPTVSVHLDYWRGLQREGDVGADPFWTTDFVFTADGGSHDWYKSKGINHHYLPAGVLEDECVEGNVTPKFTQDVIFVGAKQYHPEWPYRTQLIEWLETTYRGRFKRYGSDTPSGTIRGQALNDLYASAKVVVGDTLCLGFSHPNYFSDRLFETTGRGGFLVFPNIEGVGEMFNTGTVDKYDDTTELITYEFGDFDQLKKTIDHFASNDEARNTIRSNGQARTRRDHTYTQRAQEVIDTVFGGTETIEISDEAVDAFAELVGAFSAQQKEETMTQILSHDPRVKFTGRPDSISDPVVVREIWCENVYECDEGSFDDTHVVVDLGANIGSFTIFAASKGAQKIIAVEPEMHNVQLLQQNLNDNAIVVGTCEVTIDNRAIGGWERDGIITNMHGDSMVFDGSTPAEDSHTVHIITLDQLFKDHNLEYVDVLKIDVEGHEGEIIRNASKATLQLCRYITLEYDANSEDLGQIVEKLTETHQVKVVGEAGGMIFARRY